MTRADEPRDLLDPTAAAIHLGITPELLFQYAKPSFAKHGDLRPLAFVRRGSAVLFSRSELDAFDHMLAGPWTPPSTDRVAIPKAVQDHLRAESGNRCAHCGDGRGVESAHIVPWAEGRSHHHGNLVRLCSRCHGDYDLGRTLTRREVRAMKSALVDRTRRLLSEPRSASETLRPPRPAARFHGRRRELARLVDALRDGLSATIWGVGGIGKSELVSQALSVCGTGRLTYWLDVERHGSVGSMLTALRAELGCPEDGSHADALPVALDDRRACVVVDGIERGLPEDLDAFEDALAALSAATHSTQFVSTTQVALHRVPADLRVRLDRLDPAASRGLLEQGCVVPWTPVPAGAGGLLAFCDGHALTLRIASALVNYHGDPAAALAAIRRRGAGSVSLPGRARQDRGTSLSLCLGTAYASLAVDERRLLWGLAMLPAGWPASHVDRGWLGLPEPLDLLASLRRWHLVEATADEPARVHALAPIRAFAKTRGRDDAPADFEGVVRRLVDDLEMMVAVLETRYGGADDIGHALVRYHQELPNLLHLLTIGRERIGDRELVARVVRIVRALMRYFFVLGLEQEGARTMARAALLAIDAGEPGQACALVLQAASLALRGRRAAPIAGHLAATVERLRPLVLGAEARADLAQARSLLAQGAGDLPAAEVEARSAVEGYAGVVATLERHDGDDEGREALQDARDDLAQACGGLGNVLLAQGRYEEAASAHRRSLSTGSEPRATVNRGQTLHQLGNCERHLGNDAVAADLYADAARIFRRVGMDEYLGNACAELGHTLLDVEAGPELGFDSAALDDCLADLGRHIGRALDPARPFAPDQVAAVLAKAFGFVVLFSLGPGLERHVGRLADFCLAAASELLPEVARRLEADGRDDDLPPLTMMDDVLRLGFLVGEAGSDAQRTGADPSRVVRLVVLHAATAFGWAHTMLRLPDWSAALLGRRFGFRDLDGARLREFFERHVAGTGDELELHGRDGAVVRIRSGPVTS